MEEGKVKGEEVEFGEPADGEVGVEGQMLEGGGCGSQPLGGEVCEVNMGVAMLLWCVD
jgi:hypothetical protein